MRRDVKRIFLFFVLVSVAALGSVSADPLSKIGVGDMTKIASAFFAESSAWREVDELQTKRQTEEDAILKELEELKVQKVDALNADDKIRAMQLEDRIAEKEKYLQEYHRVMLRRINSKKEELYKTSGLAREMVVQVRYIAETEGYSVIMNAQDQDLVWWSPEVDITQKVLDRLIRVTKVRN